MINEKLMTKAELQNYVLLDDIDTLRAQLSGLLSSQLSSLANNLIQAQTNLAQALSQHSKGAEV